eukprot:TRINITY_DN16779_c0_g1::TRINITY_DN16779_c0_g1_i1::g.11148::m.11148 TRINITY_DN16779_c0_g1::TRINITY_DN16779_c0_g1_i1::g.11148  ORF type:complete len:263 (-),score=-0.07,sp/Q43157/RPE_SPIOL/56.07/1e-92,Ribul_P_3_epim/PF00834.14/1.5e-88,PcrB/PF01884.12/2.9e+02,PcrB/PF01884.12/0.0028,Trp_syntA/PF00290.15/0.0089,Peptidase_U32/PF01136.14/8.8e+02,Peptidase_U32/PF01136.14/0.018,His_biosynth/PF00977.16/3.7e+03,His_biosynth/PF00977.16/0.058,QRPTase_C/PF01729.14/2.7e+02,QRPTase_C/PF01729.14/0.39,PEP_mutase/P
MIAFVLNAPSFPHKENACISSHQNRMKSTSRRGAMSSSLGGAGPVKIAPSILSANFATLGDEIKKIEKAGADWVHIDVMDGHYVPNITVGPLVVQALRPITKLPLDVHLMITNADLFIPHFAKAGADIISVHCEPAATTHLHRTLSMIREQGCRAGVVLNPATHCHNIEHILELCDLILLISVNPGFGGQAFIPSVLKKIEQVANMVQRASLNPFIEVDGGISSKTAQQVIDAGANVLVAGSAVFGSDDYRKVITELRKTKT